LEARKNPREDRGSGVRERGAKTLITRPMPKRHKGEKTRKEKKRKKWKNP